jgi:hypothetical protein
VVRVLLAVPDFKAKMNEHDKVTACRHYLVCAKESRSFAPVGFILFFREPVTITFS